MLTAVDDVGAVEPEGLARRCEGLGGGRLRGPLDLEADAFGAPHDEQVEFGADADASALARDTVAYSPLSDGIQACSVAYLLH